MQPKSVLFQGFSISSGAYRVVSTDAFSSPQRAVIAAELARDDGAVALFRKFKSRTIKLTGTITQDTISAYEAAVDALKQQLYSGVGYLDIDYAGGTRRFTGEMQNVIISQQSGEVSTGSFSAELFCAMPFALDKTSAVLVSQTITTASTSFAVSALGTYLALPVYTLTINSITPTNSSCDIVIGNPALEAYMTISRTWANGDTITIDTVKKQIFVNGTLIQGSGFWPFYQPGSGSLEYSDTATTRNISLSASYDKRYI